ncbi:putative cell surface glycoprotein [Tieghemostelium lacteum]|uniref:Putative cell surface glycoprotein n=1 Tax=Tieghemostelium lacteum TaxID=361077 RepID=A0A151Z339_TIELA|nr:putative cell surface glycoprotein [Tieghemostelium lacteum]|eukprot:KYQ88370.1 putative cell surface glycoprotein [Tieghemostelium lacteum]
MKIPNTTTINILNNIVNIRHNEKVVYLNSIEYLYAFIRKFTLISKEWNEKVIPKLCPRNPFILDNYNRIEKSQLEFLIKSKIQFQVYLNLNIVNELDDLKTLIKDRVSTLHLSTVPNHFVVTGYPNLKSLLLSISESDQLEDLDDKNLEKHGIKLDLSLSPSDGLVDSRIHEYIFNMKALSSFQLYDYHKDFIVLPNAPFYKTLKSLSLISVFFDEYNHLEQLFKNLEITEEIYISSLSFISYPENMNEMLLDCLSNIKITPTISNLTVEGVTATPWSSLIKLFNSLVSLKKFSMSTECFEPDSEELLISQQTLDLLSLVTFEPSTCILPKISSLKCKSLIVSDLSNPDMILDDLFPSPLLSNLMEFKFHNLNQFNSYSHNLSEFFNSLIRFNSENLKSIEVELGTNFYGNALVESISKNSNLKWLTIISSDINSLVNLLKSLPLSIEYIKVNVLQVQKFEDFNTIVPHLQCNQSLKVFVIGDIQPSILTNNISYMPMCIEILSKNNHLSTLILPYSTMSTATNSDLESLEHILKSNTNLSHLYSSDKRVVSLMNKYLCLGGHE